MSEEKLQHATTSTPTTGEQQPESPRTSDHNGPAVDNKTTREGRNYSLSRPQRNLLISVAAPVSLFAVWCIVTYGNLIDDRYLPTPTALVAHSADLWEFGFHGTTLGEHLVDSLIRMLIGFSLAAVLGIALGLLMGYYDSVGAYFRGIFAFFRPIPPIAFIPLTVIFFGIGQTSKIILIFYAAFLFMVLNTEAGVNTISSILIRAGNNLGLSKFQLFRYVILPGSMPHIISAARTALAIAWALVVASELVAADKGLGYMILEASNFFQLDTVYVGIFVVGIVGVLMDTLLLLVKKRLLHWQGSN